jgi:hypothetical protein
MLSRHPLEFWEAVDYFRANRKRIAKEYKDQFVAILDNKVVDCDTHLGSLGDRVRKTFPGRDPYMPYTNAMSLEEMQERFKFDAPVDWKHSREEAEAVAADEFIRRMNESMNHNLNG